MRYQGHVNTQDCNKSNSIKYLFKYVNKGPDRESLKITKFNEDLVIDKIQKYYDCRYTLCVKQLGKYLGLIFIIDDLLFKD